MGPDIECFQEYTGKILEQVSIDRRELLVIIYGWVHSRVIFFRHERILIDQPTSKLCEFQTKREGGQRMEKMFVRWIYHACIYISTYTYYKQRLFFQFSRNIDFIRKHPCKHAYRFLVYTVLNFGPIINNNEPFRNIFFRICRGQIRRMFGREINWRLSFVVANVEYI